MYICLLYRSVNSWSSAAIVGNSTVIAEHSVAIAEHSAAIAGSRAATAGDSGAIVGTVVTFTKINMHKLLQLDINNHACYYIASLCWIVGG